MAGDIILKFDGKTIEKSVDLPRAVGDTKPGTKSVLQVLRKGSQRDIPIVVSELDVDTKRPAKVAEPPKPPVTNNLGLSVVDLGDDKRKQGGIASGVLVESVEGSAASTGLRRDDIVLGLNNAEVMSAKQFNEQVARLDPKKQAFLLVRRGENVFYLLLRPTQKQ